MLPVLVNSKIARFDLYQSDQWFILEQSDWSLEDKLSD